MKKSHPVKTTVHISTGCFPFSRAFFQNWSTAVSQLCVKFMPQKPSDPAAHPGPLWFGLSPKAK